MKASVLSATAHHEAGHAVAAVLKKVPFKQVSVIEQADAAGHIAFLRPARSLVAMHARGMVAMAGEAAQRRYNPRSVRRHHGGSDRDHVLAYAMECSGSADEATLLAQLWVVQARNLVESRWATIARVAAELLNQSALTQDAVAHLVWGQFADGPGVRLRSLTAQGDQ